MVVDTRRKLTFQQYEKISSFDVKKKKMFGCPVYFAKDNMLAGIFENDIFIRLSEQDRQKIISENDEVMPFEPMKGRVMKEYVVLPDSLYNDPENKCIKLRYELWKSWKHYRQEDR